MKTQKQLTARPAVYDYKKELESRFNGQPLLLRMDYSFGSSEQRRPYEIKDGIAMIGITGVLSNDACWWDETDYGDIQEEVSMAADDSEVKGILLCVNSPGGTTDNAFETAGVIEAAGKKKPLWAVAAPIAYSAAYLLASKATMIYMASVTGGVGSIGVYGVHFDISKMLADAGVKPTIMSAGEGKTDGTPYEPLSPEAKARFVAEVNRLYGEFVQNVAAGRRMSGSAVVKLGAFLYEGAKAGIGAGLADRAGDLSSAHADLAAKIAATPLKLPGSAASADNSKLKTKGDNRMEPEATATKPPTEAELAALRAEASTKGYSEAGEVLDLCMLAGVGIKDDKGVTMTPMATAQKFIQDRKPVADVRKALMEAKATASEKQEINGAALPGAGADYSGKPKQSMKERAQARFGKAAH